MQKISSHIVLAHGSSLEAAKKGMARFFRNTSLVQYDHLEIDRDQMIRGTDASFSDHIDQAIEKNKATVKKLVEEIKETGISSIDELEGVSQGYPSKTLHILSHFLDGFIGVDSKFYSLPEDSHWLSKEMKETLANNPDDYWLFYLTGYSYTPEEASILHK